MAKLSDFHDKAGGDAAAADEPESTRSRFFADRQLNRRSVNDADSDSKDVWTQARNRKQQGDRDEDKRGAGRHDKDHDGERRNGYGHDPRWSREDNRRNGDRPAGGWRDREAAKRGGRDHHEDTPEWADDPLAKKEQEMGLGAGDIKTANDFEAWKKSMKQGSKIEAEKESEPAATPGESEPALQQPKPSIAPLKLEGFNNGFFELGPSTPGASTPAAKPGGRGRTSRFASMFKAPEPEQTPAPVPTPTEESRQDANANSAAKATAEDQEGFNKVLQMLGGGFKLNASSAAPAPPPSAPPESVHSPPREATRPALPSQQSHADPMPSSLPPQPTFKGNGTLGRKSRFAGYFAGEQKSPERLQSLQQPGDSMLDGTSRGIGEEIFRRPERQASDHQQPQAQMSESAMSPAPSANPYNVFREQQPRPSSGRPAKDLFDLPSRGAASPDINIQDLLARQSRSRQQHATSSQSQDLLNLLKKGGSSDSRPPSGQALPDTSAGIDEAHFSQWLRSQQQQQRNAPEPHAPKPRVPQQPPGLFEEQLMRNFSEPQRHEQMQRMPLEMPEKRALARPPPGFLDEHTIFMQHQQQQHMRQQYGERPSMSQQMQQQQPLRRMSGHPNPPQMQTPQQQHQPDFHQMTSPIGGGAPPPGFGSHMPRHPPGFHGLNVYQQDAQQRQQAPPGFGGAMSPPGNAPPGFFPGTHGMPPGFPGLRAPNGNPIPSRVPHARGYEDYPGELRR